jgi:DNA-binding NtrC family response regulator
VFSTSSRSLLELAGLQQFDLELAVRLSTIEIELPTLSARQSDVPAIATHWLDLFQSSRRSLPLTLGREVVEQLLEFRWTGDLEQLRSVLIEAASRLPNGGVLLPEHLPEVIRFGLQAQRIGRPAEQSLNLDSYLENIERLLLERALQQSGMNKAKAARLLGLTRQRFLRRCEHLQLNFPEEPIDFRPADDLNADEIEEDRNGGQI